MSQFAADTEKSNQNSSFFGRIRKSIVDTVRPITPVPNRDSNSLSSSTQSINNADPLPPQASSTVAASSSSNSKPYRLQKFDQLLNADNVDLNALRKLSWNGIPYEYRPVVWQLLLGYLPTHKGRREQTIARKRKEYQDAVVNYYDIAQVDREGELMIQILKDLPRTSPDTPFFQQAPVQKCMERILYIWSTRHPASSYVQGMNDLLTPLLLINLIPHVLPLTLDRQPNISDVLRCDVEGLPNTHTVMQQMEADAYWCLTKLLDNIQDHYTDAQPGLQRMGMRLEDLIKRIDAELHQHFEDEGLMYVQFSFRWMNCQLLRELPLRAIFRVWDTYLSEERSGFENFHVYVCAVLLKSFRETLLGMQFQDMVLFLQDIPTKEWGEDSVEPILSQAYILSTLFDDSPSHLK